MRDGLSLDDLGRQFSWSDLRSYIKWARPDSALAYVNQNPPVDPATVPRAAELHSLSDRMAQARAVAAGQDTTPVRRGRKSA